MHESILHDVQRRASYTLATTQDNAPYGHLD